MVRATSPVQETKHGVALQVQETVHDVSSPMQETALGLTSPMQETGHGDQNSVQEIGQTTTLPGLKTRHRVTPKPHKNKARCFVKTPRNRTWCHTNS